MWQDLLSFAAKYWLELIFTIFVGAVTFFGKKYISMAKNERKIEQEKFKTEITSEIKAEIQPLRDELNILKEGTLSMQGKQFKETCELYLDSNHKLTIEEYEQLIKDHDAYNALGGNHEGDRLFSLVERKAENTLTQIEQKK